MGTGQVWDKRIRCSSIGINERLVGMLGDVEDSRLGVAVLD